MFYMHNLHVDVYCLCFIQGDVRSNFRRLLLRFQQCVQFFARNFTQLFSNKLCITLPSFVEIYQKMTKLCRLNQDIPHFSALSRCLPGNLLVALKRVAMLVIRYRHSQQGCRGCRCTPGRTLFWRRLNLGEG